MDVEPIHELSPLLFDRLDADLELGGDFLRRPPLGDALEYLTMAGRQPLEGIGLMHDPPPVVSDQMPGYRRAQVGLAACDRREGQLQLRGRRVLQEISRG